MKIEDAIKTAIDYEQKVRDVYAQALEGAESPMAKKVYRIMAQEEQDHVDYLEGKLEAWLRSGNLSSEDLETALPKEEEIKNAVNLLVRKVEAEGGEKEIKVLEKALDVEQETSAFYEKLVQELPSEGKRFFERFLEIESGHVALVQAEIDSLRGNGFWFDMPEFDIERG